MDIGLHLHDFSPKPEMLDPDWVIIDRGEELLSKAESVSHQIDERVRKTLGARDDTIEAHS
jgi:hypothetical protein